MRAAAAPTACHYHLHFRIGKFFPDPPFPFDILLVRRWLFLVDELTRSDRHLSSGLRGETAVLSPIEPDLTERSIGLDLENYW